MLIIKLILKGLWVGDSPLEQLEYFNKDIVNKVNKY